MTEQTVVLTSERREQILAVAAEHIRRSIGWDYTDWDIPVMDGKLTYGEWQWLREHARQHVTVTVSAAPDAPNVVDTSEDGDEEE
jgi:thiamine phosphate synthase YjbQ (UPF0047 family)